MKKIIIYILPFLFICCRSNDLGLIQRDQIEEVVFCDFGDKSFIDVSIRHCQKIDWHQFYLNELKIGKDNKSLWYNYRVDTNNFNGKDYLMLYKSRSGAIVSESDITKIIANRYKLKVTESYKKNNMYFTYFLSER